MLNGLFDTRKKFDISHSASAGYRGWFSNVAAKDSPANPTGFLRAPDIKQWKNVSGTYHVASTVFADARPDIPETTPGRIVLAGAA